MSAPIESLPNLGPASSRWLREAGIDSVSQLRKLGAIEAYLLVKRRQPKASLNLLWALAAGLEGRDWRALTDQEKTALKQTLEDKCGD